jgi:hypothetical protein
MSKDSRRAASSFFAEGGADNDVSQNSVSMNSASKNSNIVRLSTTLTSPAGTRAGAEEAAASARNKQSPATQATGRPMSATKASSSTYELDASSPQNVNSRLGQCFGSCMEKREKENEIATACADVCACL